MAPNSLGMSVDRYFFFFCIVNRFRDLLNTSLLIFSYSRRLECNNVEREAIKKKMAFWCRKQEVENKIAAITRYDIQG